LACCHGGVGEVFAEVFEGGGEIGCCEGIDSFLPCSDVLGGYLIKSVYGLKVVFTARTALRRAGSLAAMGRTVFLSPFDSSSIAGVTRQTCLI